jgi:hypothetical protein
MKLPLVPPKPLGTTKRLPAKPLGTGRAWLGGGNDHNGTWST